MTEKIKFRNELSEYCKINNIIHNKGGKVKRTSVAALITGAADIVLITGFTAASAVWKRTVRVLSLWTEKSIREKAVQSFAIW